MTGLELLEGFGFIDERYIAEADMAPVKHSTPWVKWASLAACLCILITAALAFGAMGEKSAMEGITDTEAPQAPGAKPEAAPEIWEEFEVDTEAAPGEPMAPAETMPEGDAVTESGQQLVEQKLIRTVNMDAETQSMTELLPQLDSLVAQQGGYYEQRYLGDRYQGEYQYAELVIRVPEEKLDSFLDSLADKMNIYYRSETTENVTLQYADTKNRVEVLEAAQKRLEELLEKAEAMEDRLAIESRLSDVRWELENYASQLRALENQVSYSTVYLSVSQVEKPMVLQERTVWEKIRDGFLENGEDMWEGLEDTFVWMIVIIPFLLPLALFAGAFWLACRIIKRKKKKQ